ncbi:MAG: hypothetical protein ACO1N0_20145 [Fluviicola sp.]
MKTFQITGICTLFLILFTTSCNETPEPVESDPFFDKLHEGEATKEELDSLMEAHGMQTNYLVKVPKDHFEIIFPVSKKYVEKETEKQLIDGEEITTYEYKANMQGKEDENLAYQLTYNYVGQKTEKELKRLFDDQREYWLSAANAKLEYEYVKDLNGVPGRELYLSIDDSNLKTSNRMYYDKGVFYRLVVVTPEGNLFNKSIKAFLDSFKITDGK